MSEKEYFEKLKEYAGNVHRLAPRGLEVEVGNCLLLHSSFHSGSVKLQRKFVASILQNFEAFGNDRPWIEGHPKAWSHKDSSLGNVQAMVVENVG